MKIEDLTIPERLTLSPDGRYFCDLCDAAVELADLVQIPYGKVCADCAAEHAGA